MATPLIELRSVDFTYPSGEVVLQKLDFSLHSGEKIGLMGGNGSGKSTLLHLIMGLINPTRGHRLFWGEEPLKEHDFVKIRRRVGFLFQNSDDQLFSPTVIEDVAFGPLNLGNPPDKALQIANETLRQLELERLANRITHQLSGGQKKLVSIATVLAMAPEVLILDEPTTALDQKTTARIVSILNELPISYLLVSHDQHFIVQTTNLQYQLEGGRLHRLANLKDP